MHVVNPVSCELAVLPEPGELLLPARGFLASVFPPVDIRFGAEDTRAFLPAGNVVGHEGTAIEAHTVVDVWLPADGLFFYGLPPDEEVKGRLAFKNGFEALSEFQRCGQTVVRTAFTPPHPVLLAGNPIAEIAVGKRFQALTTLAVALSQLVVVDQRMETVTSAPVPDMPDERAIVEQLAVLLEETIT